MLANKESDWHRHITHEFDYMFAEIPQIGFYAENKENRGQNHQYG